MVTNNPINANQTLATSSSPTFNALTLTTPLSVGNGGTGANTLTNGGILYGNTTSAIAATAALSAGQMVVGTGGDPFNIQAMVPGNNMNLEMALSGGTLTIQGVGGTALSATNPAFVCFQSKSVPGRPVVIPITANQTVTDGAAGQTDNARFGLTTALNWGSNFPMYMYAVMDDTETAAAFMFSRVPHATSSPASTSISKAGAIVNVGQGDFFSMANVTLTSYDANPCVLIGSLQAQFAGATDSITFQTLTTTDGINAYNEATNFTFPQAVFGAAAGTYILANGGTAPVFTTNTYTYNIEKRGYVSINMFLDGDGGADGAGAVACLLTIPFNGLVATGYAQLAFTIITGGATSIGAHFVPLSTNNQAILNTVTAGTQYTNANFPAGGRRIAGLFRYPISVS